MHIPSLSERNSPHSPDFSRRDGAPHLQILRNPHFARPIARPYEGLSARSPRLLVWLTPDARAKGL